MFNLKIKLIKICLHFTVRPYVFSFFGLVSLHYSKLKTLPNVLKSNIALYNIVHIKYAPYNNLKVAKNNTFYILYLKLPASRLNGLIKDKKKRLRRMLKVLSALCLSVVIFQFSETSSKVSICTLDK